MGLRTTEATGLVGWIDQRLSIMDAWNNHLAQYWTVPGGCSTHP